MANVTGAFFSTWASGSIGKCLTVRACFNDVKFVMAVKKRSAGKRHPIQEYNSQVFKERAEYVKKAFYGD